MDHLGSGSPEPSNDSVSGARRLRRWTLAVLVVAAVVAGYVFLPIREWLDAAAAELRDLGVLGGGLYALLYVSATLLAFPAAILSLGAGFAWGPWLGLAIAVPSATLAASTGFVLARTIFRVRFRRWLGGHPRFSAIDNAVNAKGAWLVLLLRFSPIFPFPLLNYLFGLTQVDYRKFALATALGMVPITFLYTYTGSVAHDFGQANLSGATLGPEKFVLLGVGVAITIAVTLWVGRAARRALREGALT